MGIKLFLNDYYDLLKFMHDNEVVILDEKVIPLTHVYANLNLGHMAH